MKIIVDINSSDIQAIRDVISLYQDYAMFEIMENPDWEFPSNYSKIVSNACHTVIKLNDALYEQTIKEQRGD